MVTSHQFNLNLEIRRALDERRPDRYAPGDSDTDKWLDELAEEFAPMIAVQEAQRRAARAIIANLEAAKTRQTLTIVRQCKLQPPLDWDFFRALPLVVGNERVAIRAVTSNDWRQFAQEEKGRTDEEHSIRMATVEGALWLADYMDQQGFATGTDLHW